MSDLARLPSYPSPTTLIARSGIQFLDFGFDPVRLKVREWGFHDAAGDNQDIPHSVFLSTTSWELHLWGVKRLPPHLA